MVQTSKGGYDAVRPRITTMSELASLLRACKEHADDDAYRLILADWLDDHGEEERAKYIRAQIASPGNLPDPSPAVEAWLGAWAGWGRECNYRAASPPAGYHRGMIHLFISGDELKTTLARISQPDFDWAWVERITANCWSEVDWAPLFECPRLADITELAFIGDGDQCNVPDLVASTTLDGLRSLAVLGFRLGTAGAEELASATRLTGLRYLHVEHCEIPGAGAACLATSSVLDGVVRLRLGSNPLCDEGLAAFATGRVRQNLRWLELSDCEIGDEGLVVLAGSDRFPALQRLFLWSNWFGYVGAKAILQAPQFRQTEIILGSNIAPAPWIDELRREFGDHARFLTKNQ